MAQMPLVPTVQSLKWLIDIEPQGCLTSIFQPYEFMLTAEDWREALNYAYDRLAPLESELLVFGNRLTEIGQLLGKYDELVHLDIEGGSKTVERPLIANMEIMVMHGDQPLLRQLVVSAVHIKMMKRQTRSAWGSVSNRWMDEGWRSGALH